MDQETRVPPKRKRRVYRSDPDRLVPPRPRIVRGPLGLWILDVTTIALMGTEVLIVVAWFVGGVMGSRAWEEHQWAALPLILVGFACLAAGLVSFVVGLVRAALERTPAVRFIWTGTIALVVGTGGGLFALCISLMQNF